MTISIQSGQKFSVKLFNYCTKNYQCMTTDSKLFLMGKLARFELLRNWISSCSKHSVKSNKISEDNSSIFGNINVDEIVSFVTTDSYYPGINLPQNVLQEILEFAKSAICYGNRDPTLGFYYSEKEEIEAKFGKQFHIASYLNETCSAVKQLENDPGLLAIAAKFLGTDPVHIGSEISWSFPVSATPVQKLKSAQVFHYDLDDYRFIKFFFYLTDVDLSSGPHVCIRKSHKRKKFSHQLLGMRCASLKEEEIVDYYGVENVVTICGKAGFGFVEDATCFHKGTTPDSKERLLLQIEFAINSYKNLRKFY